MIENLFWIWNVCFILNIIFGFKSDLRYFNKQYSDYDYVPYWLYGFMVSLVYYLFSPFLMLVTIKKIKIYLEIFLFIKDKDQRKKFYKQINEN